MESVQRGNLWRTLIGGIVAGAVGSAIILVGQSYIFNNIIGMYYDQFFFGRFPWLILLGAALALVGNLATIRLDYRNEPFPITLRVAIIGISVTLLVATIQQLALQGLPFFFDFFAILLMNTGWFLVVTLIPFMILTLILQFLVGFTRRSRSARDLMPHDLVVDVERKEAHARRG